MISSIDTDKAFVKIQHPFKSKGKYLLGKLYREGNKLNLIRNIYPIKADSKHLR